MERLDTTVIIALMQTLNRPRCSRNSSSSSSYIFHRESFLLSLEGERKREQVLFPSSLKTFHLLRTRVERTRYFSPPPPSLERKGEELGRLFGYSGIVDPLIFVSRNELLIARVGRRSFHAATRPRSRRRDPSRRRTVGWGVRRRGGSRRAHSRIITRQ